MNTRGAVALLILATE